MVDEYECRHNPIAFKTTFQVSGSADDLIFQKTERCFCTRCRRFFTVTVEEPALNSFIKLFPNRVEYVQRGKHTGGRNARNNLHKARSKNRAEPGNKNFR